MSDVSVNSQIQALRDMHSEALELGYRGVSVQEFLSRQANTVLEQHSLGNEAVTFHLTCWCPSFVGKPAADIMNAPMTLELARETIAKEYGYADWAAVELLGDAGFDIEFEHAVDLALGGQVAALRDLLGKKPALAKQTSQHPHRATLLHYLAANGVESHRQVTPLNAPEVMACLIEAGAEVDAEAAMYGGSTVLELWVSSAHPRDAGVLEEGVGVLGGI